MVESPPASDAEPGRAAFARARALFQQRRDAEAWPHAQAAVEAGPDWADAWTLLGILCQRLARPGAEAAYRTALRLRPDYADAWTNLGNLLRERDDAPGSLRAFQQAMQCAPRSPEPPYNLGVALEHFGLWDGALAAFEAAVACDPSHVDAQWNRALALLRAGRYDEGFRAYEARFARGEPAPRDDARPVWDGRPLPGRTLLVWAEQGYGDTLQFLRFLPAAAARSGDQRVLEVMDGLQGLAARLPGVSRVVVRGQAVPEADAHVALMSLPYRLGLTPADAAVPYLRPSATAAASAQAGARTEVGAGAGAGAPRNAGLVWATQPALRTSRDRSPGLAALRPLLALPGLQWVSLQKGAGRDELLASPPPNLADPMGAVDDFDATASLVAGLDLVVSCDTAVAHLAGAMGKPTFVLLPYARDWRHGLDAHASPWYPSMRLFRQSTRGDWAGVVARVVEALGARG